MKHNTDRATAQDIQESTTFDSYVDAIAMEDAMAPDHWDFEDILNYMIEHELSRDSASNDKIQGTPSVPTDKKPLNP